MINEKELIAAGKFGRVHGLDGQINFQLTDLVFDDEDDFPLWVFVKNDGYFVPFRIDEVFLSTGNSGRISLSLNNSAEQSKPLVNCPFYFRIADIDLDGQAPTPAKLIGYAVFENHGALLGNVIDFEDLPNNPLLVLALAKGEMLLPFNSDIITEINPVNQTIIAILPEGYLDVFA